MDRNGGCCFVVAKWVKEIATDVPSQGERKGYSRLMHGHTELRAAHVDFRTGGQVKARPAYRPPYCPATVNA